jgi:uncharacterized repeat protein (TIGR01451 family)
VERLARWLVLITLTCAILALTAALIGAASPTRAQYGGPDGLQKKPLAPSPQSLAPLEPDLAKALATAGPDQRLNIIVEMQEQVAPGAVASSQAIDANARRHMVDAMQYTAQQTQAGVRVYLSARRLTGDVTRVTPFWIFNGLAVQGARPDVVRDLAALPGVAVLRLDHWRQWIESDPAATNRDTHPTPLRFRDWRHAARNAQHVSLAAAPWGLETRDTAVEWGVGKIRADEVWDSLGVDGRGVVVANLDTGVDWQHPALQSSYRGYSSKGFHQHEGNWYDATDEGALYPVDGHGHGSHTMGTLIGSGGIGVAPGARWIAVRGFDSEGFAFDSWLHAAFEWLLAPNGDPNLAPRIVDNSWGNSESALTTFQRDLEALRAAGIFALFSVGNDGPSEGSVGSPASLPGAFAVGASDQDDEIAQFSSRGLSPWGEVRPHVVAPGVNVRSAMPGGAYKEMQGTSMAAPHAAGVVALVLSARPDLTITQTAYILTSTAVPLSFVIPNNDSGYGRVDAYAAVALAANAGLISGTVHDDGVPLPGATVQASPAISGFVGSATSDSQGHYQLFLSAGYYDLTAHAFGYALTSVHALSVTTGGATKQDFDLTPLPTGHLQGTVTTADGQAVEAEVTVLGTPVVTTSTAGSYRLDLPSGNYTVEVRALGYRVVTANVTVAAGLNTVHHFVLPESMRILLVDSGSWYYQSQASYYRQALDDLSYAYDERHIKHLPDDAPTFADLSSYDLVVWSAPSDSPGMVGVGVWISAYLASGGNLWLSGQDVAFWDGGGSLYVQSYYVDYVHSIYRADNAPSRQVTCLDNGAFGGITLTVQGGDGADNQDWPDEIEVFDSDHASLACTYDRGQGAVIQAGFCDAQRVLNLGFGFEAINSATDRSEFMARALDWFASPRQAAGVELLPQTGLVQVAPAGGTVTHTFRLRNLGEAGSADRIRIKVNGDEWPATVLRPSTDLGPCETTLVDVRVEIPSDLTWNAFDVLSVTAYSSAAPAFSQTLTVTSKVPAPVLLVDDDRWYDQEPVYEAALSASSLPYDRWEVTEFYGAGSPPAGVLAWYPLVLWFTGYDWFDPLHLSEADRLADYLQHGGRLFLSSQDAIHYVDDSALMRDYFGVISYSWVLSQTAVQGVPGHVLGDGLGPVGLVYPFRNWSDSVLPAPGDEIAFRGQHGQPAAVTREGDCSRSQSTCRWRSAFFAFPFEALPEAMRATLMSRLVGWLSWLGGSDLKSDRTVAQVGDAVGYALALRNDGPGAVLGVTVSNTLPAGMLLLEGPDGGADYDVRNQRITWTGDLDPGAAITFTYRLHLLGDVGDRTVRNVADVILGEQGLHFQRQASVRVAAPDLSASSLRQFQRGAAQSPAMAKASDELTATLVIRNDGLADALNATVDNPLPWPLRLITGTLSAEGGGTATELPWENRVLWQGEVAVGTPVTLTYRAVAPPVLLDDLWLYNAARVQDGLGGAWERGGWLYAQPHLLYFPVFFKDG